MSGTFRGGTLAALALLVLACGGGGGDDQAPAWPAGAALEIASLDATSLRVAWPEAQDNEAVTAYRLSRDGELEAELGAATLEHSISGLTPSTSYQLQVQAGDAAGNWSVDGPSLEVVTESGLPPDPALVASEIDRSVFQTFYSRMSFLWESEKPVVWGADPKSFDERTLVVLRGRVLDEDGQPLSWVDVRIPEHPEFGHTVTREDGRYDLAANGGGLLIVRFSQSGLLPVERKVRTPWRDFFEVPDVVLIPADANASTVNLDGSGASAQLAYGSSVEDADGARQASLLLPSGTKARAVLADGTEQDLDAATLRITEYTLGEQGPARMPARMPANIAYTYAVELGLDEAPDGSQVVFDEPVVFHVDNFLGFPAGTTAPLGHYDSERAVWVPAESGLVVLVLREDQGMVDLDADGDGLADDAARLAELGITEEELSVLAERFDAGDSFIRVRLEHFSTYDINWGFSVPADGISPFRVPNKSGCDNGCEESGSVIDVHNQVLGEDISLTGLPFGLHYRSDRVPGRLAAYSLKIPLVGPEAPASLKGVELEVRVAGQEHFFKFDADPDPATEVDFHEFTWDGLDAYGRRLQGSQPITIRTGYTYDGVMQANERFGYAGNGAEITASRTRQELTLWLEWTGSIGAMDAKALGLGGWTLGVHHAYDPHGRVLYRGDGTRRSADRLEPIVNTVAGGGSGNPFNEPGIQATTAKIGAKDVALGPNGSIYMASAELVYRVDPDGNTWVVAGGGEDNEGEGIAATDAYLWGVNSLNLDRQGNLYLALPAEHRVRKIDTEGRIWTVAGQNRVEGSEGDGGPAEQSLLNRPQAVLAASDGSVYIADKNNYVIRRIGTDGRIDTVAGQAGVWSHNGVGDGGPAVDATLDLNVIDLTEGPDGSLYFVESTGHRVRRIDLSGTITTVAGKGPPTSANEGDGGPAVEAGVYYPHSIAVGSDGTMFIATDNMVRRVGPDGVIRTLAGTGEGGVGGDGGPASQATFSEAGGLALDAEGVLYYADLSSNDNRIRAIASPLPGFAKLGDDIVLPSASGAEVFWFSAEGRHLQTLHGLTGAVLWSFEYAEDGSLSAITDGDGNRTSIAWYSPSSFDIVPPFAHATHVNIDEEGFVQSVSDPLGRSVVFNYQQEGLLTHMQDAKGQGYEFLYDSQGRLTSDTDPAGAAKKLRLDDETIEDGSVVEFESAEGRVSTYRTEHLPDGSWQKVNAFPGGLVNRLTEEGGTQSQLILADGSQRETVLSADPRFSMSAPILKSQTITTPAGLRMQMEQSKTMEPENGSGVFSFDRISSTLTINGKTSTVAYDASDRSMLLTTPEGRRLAASFDEQGRPLQSELVDSGIWPVEQVYDDLGRLREIAQGTGSERRVSSLHYDVLGFVDSMTDALSRTVSFVRDDAGRVIAQTLPDGRVIQFAWDDNDNLVGLTPPGRPEHVMGYGPVDEMESYDPPDVGLPSDMTSYAYNLDRQLTKMTRPDGARVDLSYQEDGRLQNILHDDDSITLSHDDHGHVTAIASATDETRLDYEYDGPLLTGETLSGPFFGRVGFAYNNDFQLESMDVTGQASVEYLHDDDGQLIQAGDLGLERDPASGLVTATTLGKLRTQRSYNAFGELESISAWYEDSLVYEVIYARDVGGRITDKSETIQGVTKQLTYFYDLAGRLERVEEGGTVIEQYSYDENSNRLSASYEGGESHAGVYDDQDRMLSYGEADYTYTANGELLSKTEGGSETQYHFDSLGNLRSVDLPDGRRIDYLIDGRNRRVGKKINGALVQGFLYADQLNPVAEVDGAGQIQKMFVYGTRVNVPEYMSQDGRTFRILSDHLGSPRLVIDVWTGEVVGQMEHDAFGRTIVDSDPSLLPFGFAGGINDRDIGLVRFGARDYDPQAGRWTAKDPIGFGGGDVQLFRYAGQDPVNACDPSGLYDIPIFPNGPGGDAHIEFAQDYGWYGGLAVLGVWGLVAIAEALIASWPLYGPVLIAGVQRGCDKTQQMVRSGYQISMHAMERMAQRNINKKMVDAAIRKGTQYYDRLNGSVSHVLRGGYASGKNLIVARNPITNTVTTVMKNSRFNANAMLPDGTLRYIPIE